MDVKIWFRLPLFIPLVVISCGGKKEDSTTVNQTDWEAVDWDQVDEWVQRKPLRKGKIVASDNPRFTRINGHSVGVDFHNQLNDENIKNYLLSGAGLTVGDIDNNGLPDLFLVSQDGPNKLFMQTAPWVFQDMSKASGIVDTKSWGSGAAFADIDNDGKLDLYVCNKGAPDEIYLNQGNGVFKGGFVGGSKNELRAPTMVAFADYDRDGDLDFYRTETRLLSINEMFGGQVLTKKDNKGIWRAHPSQATQFEMIDGLPRELGTQDRLYRNDGSTENGMPKLVDATRDSGIAIAREHGLAAVWWDYNNDGWPDLYVSNDFHTPDHLYRNNGDSTFTEVTEEALPYTSWYSMGSDFADINNDGWFDYLSTDMSGTTHFKQKTMMGAMTDTAWFLDNLEPRQYMRNAMQINAGTGQFIDVAFYAGLDSTDWTWAGIFGDLDNDGFEDAFFTNGIERNVQDSDWSLKMNEAKEAGATKEELKQIFLDSPRLMEQNLAFRNLGNLRFRAMGNDWGLNGASVSHGAVLADLDRDGDLDLVVNNMNDPVGLFRNDGEKKNAILLSLSGTASNRFGLDARLTVELSDGLVLNRIVTSSRGYMSGSEPVTHFGWSRDQDLKSLTVIWPSGHHQLFNGLESGWHYKLTEPGPDTKPPSLAKDQIPKVMFTEAEEAMGIKFEHNENSFEDFKSQPLLPNRMSRFGPGLAVGDADGDGDEDVFVGSAKDRQSAIYIQEKRGSFHRVPCPALEADKSFEDVDAVWLDLEGDSDLDLYVVSGGASEIAGDIHYQDRIYLNDGSGSFSRMGEDVLPKWSASGSRVAGCDFDGDGDTDLFVCARFVPGQYPNVPESALLVNEGGRFVRVDSPVSSAGMATGAAWSDLNGDGRPDLIVSTEWGPLQVYGNQPSGFVKLTEAAGLDLYTGWWTCVVAGDVDRDGDNDLIAGNFGLNTKYHVIKDRPATMFAADFGGGGTIHLVEAQHKEGKLLPIRGRSCSTSAMPHLLERVPSYSSFASKTLQEIYTPNALNKAWRLEANTLATTLFRNNGRGQFSPEPLPKLSQMAPVMDIAMQDLDEDGYLDVVLAQNFNAAQRETGRMNAGLGVVLMGQKDGNLEELWPAQSGFAVRADPRRVIARDLNGDGTSDLLLGQNGGFLRVFGGEQQSE